MAARGADSKAAAEAEAVWIDREESVKVACSRAEISSKCSLAMIKLSTIGGSSPARLMAANWFGRVVCHCAAANNTPDRFNWLLARRQAGERLAASLGAQAAAPLGGRNRLAARKSYANRAAGRPNKHWDGRERGGPLNGADGDGGGG